MFAVVLCMLAIVFGVVGIFFLALGGFLQNEKYLKGSLLCELMFLLLAITAILVQ